MNGLGKRLDDILSYRYITGVNEGEKIVLLERKNRLVFLCSDFVSAGKYKRGFESLGKKVEIITASREGKLENDANLMPFVASINGYILGRVDVLLVLPCSAMIKFNLGVFKEQNNLNVGGVYSLSQLTNYLAKIGYLRSDLVSKEGEFALRGDILDIFIPGEELPVRIEFFDEIIEKIHYFDPSSMKNIKEVENISLSPAVLTIGENSVFDLDGTRVIDEPKRIEDEFEMLEKSYQTMSNFDKQNYHNFENLFNGADIIFDSTRIHENIYENKKLPSRSYLTDFMALKQDLLSFLQMKLGVILFAGSEHNKGKIAEFLTSNGFVYHDYEKEVYELNKIFISSLAFPFSFSFLNNRVLAIGVDSLFKQQTSVFSKGRHAVFYLPKLGDYVVHTFHGIGKCIKIERMKIADYEKDYFVIEYKNGGVLYLPSEQANTISAYIGSEEEPKLSALGGAEFARLKTKVKSGLKEMAISLIEIYNERQHSKGYKFSRDEFLDKKFADSFGYSETRDQLRAISEIEKDMESDRIMDRLVCGDVGFGKTEVALRAAFKCIYNGRQVALLCPTTILSQQHERTAKARLEAFGAKVEVLNRFKTPSQVKDILLRLKDGKVDMLIGTHRLLSSDVQFKDLGLLILDEEQRFGVEDKEKIKNAKRSIDVLSLSATPIPRTLNMSLSGIRDISVIETPPKERLPIQTYVAEQADDLIRDVLAREITRGGQAFVIYNRVETIEEFASYIRTLLPNAKIGIAHGQMQERQLENVINKLYDGEFNIFISTTLIENGIDLPSANTMIIIDADRLGLGQLYQIRGRIGRSDKLSYAYLLYDKDKILTQDAYKRLSSIKEFSELGSGFKIAMRDLEIRGAGNIFGKEQHGHIAKVGYDMFVKLLDEAVQELQGKSLAETNEVKLEINLDAFISEDYIQSSDERILMYTRISNLLSSKDEEEILKSIQDGFGVVPSEVKNLCKLALLKNLASRFNVLKIRVNATTCNIVLNKSEEIVPKPLAEHLKEFGGVLSFDNFPNISFDRQGSTLNKVEKLISFFETSLNKS